MISKEVIKYLDDENISMEKKHRYIENLSLNYSDLYDLKEMYKHDEKIYRMFEHFCYYYYDHRTVLIQRDKEHREYEARKKMKKMKFKMKGNRNHD